MEKEFNVVGARLPMIDAAAKVNGSAQFTDDLVFPGMLHGKILRSPFPHAKILHVDVSKALRLPGVKGVVTGDEIPDRQYGIVPKARDEYALAKGKVRYIGDEVAAVCAIDPEIAEEAVDLIKVDYEELPAVFDPREAIKEGAPIIHEGVANNTSFAIKKEFGDVKKAFAESALVSEDTFYSQPVNHAPLEPHAAVAQYDPIRGQMVLWSGTQIPFFLRRNLAATLQIPESKVRVIKPKVGGGFGQKIDMFAKDFCAAWFAIKTGRPVKFVYERDEVFIVTRQRHPMYLTVKTGMAKDGRILGQQFLSYADGGAYNRSCADHDGLILLFSHGSISCPQSLLRGIPCLHQQARWRSHARTWDSAGSFRGGASIGLDGGTAESRPCRNSRQEQHQSRGAASRGIRYPHLWICRERETGGGSHWLEGKARQATFRSRSGSRRGLVPQRSH